MIKRFKLTTEHLSFLSYPLNTLSLNQQCQIIGGGNGTSLNDPYSLEEYKQLGLTFTKGWVDFGEHVSYLTENYYSYTNTPFEDYDHYSTCSDMFNGDWNVSDSSYYSYNSDYCELPQSNNDIKINALYNTLPPQLREAISGINIIYDENLTSSGCYNAATNTICLRVVDYDTLFREAVHAVQDLQKLCGDNGAAKEFQEHVIGDIQFIVQLYYTNDGHGGSTTTFNGGVCKSVNEVEFEQWLLSCLDEQGVLKLSDFLSKINNYLIDFQNSHQNTSGYQGEVESDYNYCWKEMFDIMGIRYK